MLYNVKPPDNQVLITGHLIDFALELAFGKDLSFEDKIAAIDLIMDNPTQTHYRFNNNGLLCFVAREIIQAIQDNA